MSENFLTAIFVAIAACALLSLNVNSQIAEKKAFSCEGRPNGYYADVSSGCQIYHMCDGLGRQFSYSCPNTTLFQQRMLICDHWYMVNCSKAELDYGANLLIGQRGKPFVEDDAENPYHRTPRPDLLAHPSAAEYNIIYRTGRAQQTNSKNLVGADSYYDQQSDNTPAYFLPSHWSTEYSKPSTEKPVEVIKTKVRSKADFKKPYYPIKTDDSPIVVNFKSNFRATTPVYPRVAPTEIPILENDFVQNELTKILLPPGPSRNKPQLLPPKQGQIKVNFASNFKATTPVYPTSVPPEIQHPFIPDGGQPQLPLPKTANIKVNFASNFKATTPVYPHSVTPEIPLAFEELPQPPSNQAYGIASIIEPPKLANQKLEVPQAVQTEIKVNFQSNFKATTPVYPTFVTSEAPLAIQDTAVDPNQLGLSTVIQPPKSYTESKLNTIQEPSIYYEPPTFTQKQNKKSPTTIRPPRFDSPENKWQELRKIFLIPDYEFPLDSSAVRPNYDQGPSSFQVNPFSFDLIPRKHA